MPKPLSFKDFLVVDYAPGTGEYISYQAKKRKKQQGAGSNAEYASYQPEGETIEEALTHAQRIKRRQQFRKMKGRIKLGRLRALRRTPTMDVVKRRAKKKARLLILKRMTRGKSKAELGFAQRQAYEKKLDKMGSRIDRLARRLIPDVRKADRERKKSALHKQTTDRSTSTKPKSGAAF